MKTNEARPIAKICLYARVSTLNHGQDCETQLIPLREYAARRGWEVVAEYADKGISGTKESRPQLDKLMQDAHQRRFDAVLVFKVDRFGRSLKHLVKAIEKLEAYGIAFVSWSDNIDLSTPAGRLMFGVISAMAEFERDLIRERVKAGLDRARKQGAVLGRKPVNRSKDKDAAEIRRMRDEGRSYAEIGDELGRSKADVYRVCMTLGCSAADSAHCAVVQC